MFNQCDVYLSEAKNKSQFSRSLKCLQAIICNFARKTSKEDLERARQQQQPRAMFLFCLRGRSADWVCMGFLHLYLGFVNPKENVQVLKSFFFELKGSFGGAPSTLLPAF